MKLLLLLFLSTSAFGADVYFGGEVNNASMNKLAKQIVVLHKTVPTEEVINIHLSSGGGNIYAGFSFMNSLKTMQAEGRRFKGIVRTICASMCFAILQTLDTRSAYPFAMLMQHKGSGGGQKHLSALDSIIEKFESERIKLPKAIWARVTEANIWIGSKEATELGILDEIVLPVISILAKSKDELDMSSRFLKQKKEMEKIEKKLIEERRKKQLAEARTRIQEVLEDDAKQQAVNDIRNRSRWR